MKKNIFKLSADTNTIVSFSAIIVSIASIFIATWQGMETRRHNRLSVRPKLEIHFSIENHGFGYSLHNNGLGPANIVENKVFFNDVEISSNDSSSWYHILIDSLNLPISFSAIWPGATIKAGEKRNLLLFNLEGLDSLKIDPMKIYKKLSFKIVYESMYREAFIYEKSR